MLMGLDKNEIEWILVTLEDGSVDVDENNGDESDDKELKLPVVRVDKGQCGRDSKLHFDVKKIVLLYY